MEDLEPLMSIAFFAEFLFTLSPRPRGGRLPFLGLGLGGGEAW